MFNKKKTQSKEQHRCKQTLYCGFICTSKIQCFVALLLWFCSVCHILFLTNVTIIKPQYFLLLCLTRLSYLKITNRINLFGNVQNYFWKYSSTDVKPRKSIQNIQFKKKIKIKPTVQYPHWASRSSKFNNKNTELRGKL